MKGRETYDHKRGHKPGWVPLNGLLSILMILAAGAGSLLSGGCVAAPVALVSSAAVSAAALVSAGESAVKDSDQMNSVVASDETGIDARPAGACPPDEATGTEDQVGTLGHQQQLNACADRTKSTDKPDDSGQPKT